MARSKIDTALLSSAALFALLVIIVPFLLPREVAPTPHSSIPSSDSYSAIVAGASGAVGRALVKELASSYRVSRIGLIVRRVPAWVFHSQKHENQRLRKLFKLNAEQAAKVKLIHVQFDALPLERALESYAEDFKGYSIGFSALGTTMRTAGSVEAFRAIDYNATLSLAALMRVGGATEFHLVSSVGANRNSMFTYPQTKGDIEHAVSQLGFTRVSIYRPGILITPRPEVDSRPLEAVAQVLVPRIHWMLSALGSVGERMKSVTVQTVGKFIVLNAESKQNPTYGHAHSYSKNEISIPVGFDAEKCKLAPKLLANAATAKSGTPSSYVEIFENEVIRGLKI